MATWLYVGLGNPGPKYERTRHNAGFLVIDTLAEQLGAGPFREKHSGLLAQASKDGETLYLVKPSTFMNKSGDCVQPAAAYFKVPPERIIVIHDELDLPFGKLRLKLGGGHAGHNGLRSIQQRLNTPGFGRVRFGIGRPKRQPPPSSMVEGPAPPPAQQDVRSYVLSDFSSSERRMLSEHLNAAAESALDVALRGLSAAMKKAHTAATPSDSKASEGSKPKP